MYVFWGRILHAIIILECCSHYKKWDSLSSKVWLELQGEVQQAENNHILFQIIKVVCNNSLTIKKKKKKTNMH